MREDLYELLRNGAGGYGVTVTDEAAAKFDRYRELLKEWNERMNLTAITDDEGIIVKHFTDSVSVVPFLKEYGGQELCGKKLADIGTGAGFPGIPLKIVCPELEICLIDSLAKRLTFLNTVIAELGLKGIYTVHARAEDAGRDPSHREKYDFATARAVAAMPVLLEYCMPMVKQGGMFLAMKGGGEEPDYKRALAELSSKQEKTAAFILCGGGNAAADGSGTENAARKIYCIRKTGRTSAKYPRKAGTASKQPL